MTAATTIVRQPALASSPQPTPTARALIAQCTKGARPRRWGEVHMKTWMPLRASRRERADCGPKRRAIARLALGDQLHLPTLQCVRRPCALGKNVACQGEVETPAIVVKYFDFLS